MPAGWGVRCGDAFDGVARSQVVVGVAADVRDAAGVEPAAGERAGGAGRGGEGDAGAGRREPLPAGDAAGGGRSGDTGLRAVRAVGGGLLARRGGAVRGHRAGLAGGGELGRRTLLRRAPGTGGRRRQRLRCGLRLRGERPAVGDAAGAVFRGGHDG